MEEILSAESCGIAASTGTAERPAMREPMRAMELMELVRRWFQLFLCAPMMECMLARSATASAMARSLATESLSRRSAADLMVVMVAALCCLSMSSSTLILLATCRR
ncbi:hypothetical protein ZIOFF_048249 [Zingiber officinale]|uniref:Uncharacterized protein n=1 Tax=Zingiber officinale TaxID=94328 RepID=A0A8J5FQE1_ZINOF|nr:hypothetical protein ZIOFF_048249 [Zingiber officinale]